ncbi:tetratricopeptide repeat protein [Chlorobium sp. BLA1]|uniref:tetratricopeptide repeat protein n=1 Tax=Candidatus Chlorobium masyuteum TaxID=2716876 RepID=UPI00141E5FFF|nr:tetratricopeptide repeat protein [Candidatus Chlorobium masyuteum]NHQ61187.1 tetratricopeptide repeat protein [Candidatus Chlorobium masyuteum]
MKKSDKPDALRVDSRAMMFSGAGILRYALRRCCVLLSVVSVLALQPLPALAKTAAEVFREVSPSVVVVHAYDNNGRLQSMGSGIVLSSGQVVTNYHVIEKAARLMVIYQGREYTAKAGYTDRFRDVCSLVVSGLQGSQITFGNTSQLRVGEKVYAIGSPQGLELTFSDGIISGLRAVDKGYYIQTTAPISLGSSGGGLFDEHARLIGIATYFFKQGQQLNFALPVEWIIDLPSRHVVQTKVNAGDIDKINQVNAFEEKQDWAGMIQFCLQWTKQMPASSDAWGYLGFAYLQKGELTLAIEAYQAAVRLRPDYAHYWADLGVAYGREGQYERMIAAYRQAVRNNNEYALAWINLGIAYIQNGSYLQAVEAYQQVVRITPGDASSWYNMGSAYSEAGHYPEAVEAYRHAVLLSPGNIQYLINLGRAYGMAGQKNKQFEAYREALQIKPDYADAWVFLAIANGEAGHEIDMREAYQRALLINPDHNTALFNLGKDYLEQGNQKKGMELYSRLKRLNPELSQLFYNSFYKLMFPKKAG